MTPSGSGLDVGRFEFLTFDCYGTLICLRPLATAQKLTGTFTTFF